MSERSARMLGSAIIVAGGGLICNAPGGGGIVGLLIIIFGATLFGRDWSSSFRADRI